jgi:hypothetical protein
MDFLGGEKFRKSLRTSFRVVLTTNKKGRNKVLVILERKSKMMIHDYIASLTMAADKE